jgi:glucosamine 6-phosphate synthetase-like amidotransferase/phosphosugar isomerase protein
MSVDTTMAVLYAQTGLGTQVAHAAAVAPHAQAAMTRVLALETAKQEQQLVEKTGKTEKKDINKDGKRSGESLFGSRRRNRTERQEAFVDNTDIFSGNLLNTTI